MIRSLNAFMPGHGTPEHLLGFCYALLDAMRDTEVVNGLQHGVVGRIVDIFLAGQGLLEHPLGVEQPVLARVDDSQVVSPCPALMYHQGLTLSRIPS